MRSIPAVQGDGREGHSRRSDRRSGTVNYRRFPDVPEGRFSLRVAMSGRWLPRPPALRIGITAMTRRSHSKCSEGPPRRKIGVRNFSQSSTTPARVSQDASIAKSGVGRRTKLCSGQSATLTDSGPSRAEKRYARSETEARHSRIARQVPRARALRAAGWLGPSRHASVLLGRAYQ
jgi:hypothetical protein